MQISNRMNINFKGTKPLPNFDLRALKIFDFETKGYEREFCVLQNGESACFAVKQGVDLQNEKQCPVIIRKTLTQDGRILRSKTETPDFYQTYTTHAFRGDDFMYSIGIKDNMFVLKEMLQLHNGKNNQSVTHTKASDRVEGFFEVEEYDLKKCPEEVDVIQAIKNQALYPAIVRSRVTRTDMVDKVSENYEWNNCSIKRQYKKTQTENGYKIDYSYYITQKDKGPIMELDRSFDYSKNESTTEIFGRSYKSIFDNENKIVKIIEPNGRETLIDFKNVVVSSTSEQVEELWEMFKNLPSDVQLDFSKCAKTITYTKRGSQFDYWNKKITTRPTTADFAHEVGHGVDCYKSISCNNRLREIYQQELNLFIESFPHDIHDQFEYFSTFVDEEHTNGREELVAETSQLLSGIVNDSSLAYRAQLIVQYFPKTVAEIAYLKFNNY